jgi:hypothetical protein
LNREKKVVEPPPQPPLMDSNNMIEDFEMKLQDEEFEVSKALPEINWLEVEEPHIYLTQKDHQNSITDYMQNINMSEQEMESIWVE